jgi:hypothetical protein
VANERNHEARERLLAALAAGANNSEAARVSGYSRKHVKELLKDAEFCALLEERRQAQDRGELERASKVGLRVLLEIAQDHEAPHAARVSAARALVAADAPRGKPGGAPKVDAPAATTGPEPTAEELQAALRVLA